MEQKQKQALAMLVLSVIATRPTLIAAVAAAMEDELRRVEAAEAAVAQARQIALGR